MSSLPLPEPFEPPDRDVWRDRYRALVAAVPGIVFEMLIGTDRRPAFTWVGGAVRELVGLDPHAVLQDPERLLGLRPPEDAIRMSRVLATAGASLEPIRLDVRFIVDGLVRWFQWSASPERVPGAIRWTGVILETTAHNRAEKELRDNEERLRLALSAANQGLYDIDLITGAVQVSPEYATLLGYDPVHFRETVTTWINRIHPADHDRVVEVFEAYIFGRQSRYEVEYRLRTADGAWKWILSLGKIVARDADGWPLRLMGTHTDVSARHRAEDALRESEYFLRRSQQIARLGSYRFDVASGTWTSSHVLNEILGIGAADRHSVQDWLDLVHPDDRDGMRDYLQAQVIGAGNRFDREYRIIRPSDGEERWVHGVGELDFDAGGRANSMFGTIQDVTERKRFAERHAALEAQLAQTHRMEAIGRLAGGVAHDFNNMLSVILGYADMMRASLSEGDVLLGDLAEIERAARHSRDITRQLLAFSRNDIITPRTVNLNRLIGEGLKTLSRLIGEDIEVGFEPAETLPSVRLDPAQFDQVLVNLIVNARDAMPTGGRVTIATATVDLDEEQCRVEQTARPGPYVVVTVRDTGVGMTSETRARVFEPFFTTKQLGHGTGLGLATVYGIVSQNGGLIDVTSEPGAGATFRICLPAVLASELAADTHVVDAEPLPGLTVLLVEDELSVRQLTERMLVALGYEVVAAGSPLEALAILEDAQRPVDLVLTDVVMPVMSGAQLRDRAQVIRPGVRVVFMSGYTANEIGRHGDLGEFVHFLQKPFALDDLARKLRQATAS